MHGRIDNKVDFESLVYFSHTDCYKADVDQDWEENIFREVFKLCLFRNPCVF